MKNYNVSNVEEYIVACPPEARPLLEELRGLIKSTVPGVEEKISWGVPFYRYHGPLGGYAPYKHHVTFGCGGADLDLSIRKTLEQKGYKTGIKTIQIKFDQKVPTKEIKDLLLHQAKINKEKER